MISKIENKHWLFQVEITFLEAKASFYCLVFIYFVALVPKNGMQSRYVKLLEHQRFEFPASNSTNCSVINRLFFFV